MSESSGMCYPAAQSVFRSCYGIEEIVGLSYRVSLLSHERAPSLLCPPSLSVPFEADIESINVDGGGGPALLPMWTRASSSRCTDEDQEVPGD